MNYLMTRNMDSSIDSLFNDMFGSWGIKNSTIPSVDVYEDNNAYHLEAELAGYEQKDVNISLDNHVLHISSEKKIDNNNHKYLIRERSYAKFDRAFTLPDNINEEGVEASFKDGILHIVMPKIPAQQPKKINIKIN